MRDSFARRCSRQLAGRLGVAAVLAVTALALQLSAIAVPEPDAVAAMESFLARPSLTHQYRAWRRLEASGSGRRGWLEVQTTFAPSSGLQYEVISEGGSRYIVRRVLRSLLDEEQRLIAHGATATVAISRENYQFRLEGLDDDGLAIVDLEPLRKDRSLIVGRMLLSPDGGDPVRVEGRLARNPSFWVTRVNVVRSYRRINGVTMPVSLSTTAQLRLPGTAALRMTYRYSHIDEQPVNDDPVE